MNEPTSPELWRLAICALQDEGIKESTARSFLALMLKTWGEKYVREAVMRSIGQANFRGSVRGWLISRCPPIAPPPNPQGSLLEPRVDPARAREDYAANREKLFRAIKR